MTYHQSYNPTYRGYNFMTGRGPPCKSNFEDHPEVLPQSFAKTSYPP